MKAKKIGVVLLATIMSGIGAQAGVIYSNSFVGAADALSKTTTPEINTIGTITQNSNTTTLDGSGRMQASENIQDANFRFNLLTTIADAPLITALKYTVSLRAPTANFVGVGFGGNSNGMLNDSVNSGPWAAIGATGITVYGGYSATGSVDVVQGTHTAGQLIDVALTYYLETATVDLAVDGTLVATGLAMTHINSGSGLPGAPDLSWLQVNLSNQATAAGGGAIVDRLVLETILPPPPTYRLTTVYQDDFSGPVGLALSNSIPEVAFSNYVGIGQGELDGFGRLEVPVSSAGYNFRFKGGIYADGWQNAEVMKYTVVMRSPTNDWVGIGWHKNNANGFLTASMESGPWIQFSADESIKLYGGTGASNIAVTVNNAYTAGNVITAEVTYVVADQTIDLAIDGTPLFYGISFVHTDAIGAVVAPAPIYFQLNLANQSRAAAGGAYVDSLKIDVGSIVVSGYGPWAAGWGVDIGSEIADYDGDGLLNIYEYGLGGDPTNELDQGASPVFGTENVGGTNYFGYVHPQLSDPVSGLSYSLALRTDLILGDWTTNAGYVVLGTNVTGGALDFVTNVTDTVDSKKFIRLIIE